MNQFVVKLLEPVSMEQPSGPDRENGVQFDELNQLLKGKPEVEIGLIKRPPEPPDWQELKTKCGEFLNGSKHLSVAMMWGCSALQTDGFAGFRDGLQLLQGLLEKYWLSFYPQLDPAEKNDPTQRLNILSGLTLPRGSSSAGWLTFIDYLYQAPICKAPGSPAITFDQLDAARSKQGGLDIDKMILVVRSTGLEQSKASFQALNCANEAVGKIDDFLTMTLGVRESINFENLKKTLEGLVQGLRSALDGAVAGKDDPISETAGTGATPASLSGSITVRGLVRNREDVSRAIEGICEYYRQVEPSSPVPYLLRRAQKLAAMDFVQAVQELQLGGIDSLRPSMGSAVSDTSGSGTTA